jgi:REP element-mobilizing transposase RayT
MDRCWLLTSTFYGNWLPGDPRGSVTSVRDEPGARGRHNTPGTPVDGPMPGLYQSARAAWKGPPILLDAEKASVLAAQFQETARCRGWRLLAFAIMRNHVHLVVGVPGDPEPGAVLGDFKAYGSRALNRQWGKPASGTWWTERGSTRKLPDEAAIRAAVEYVRNQEHPLITWVAEDLGERTEDLGEQRP